MSTIPRQLVPKLGLIWTALAIGVLPACASGDAASDQPGGQPGQSGQSESVGGALTVALDGTVKCLDPWQTDVPAEHNIYRQVVETLTSIEPDDGTLRPWLAESWEVSDDATEFTFKLRPNVHFSNGQELTAQAVKANFDQAATLEQAVRAPSYLAGYTETRVVDQLTAVVVFDEPNASFLNHSASDFLAILAPETVETAAETRCTSGVIGTGPFLIDSYRPNQDVVLKARSDYDSAPAWAAHAGRAYLDQITFALVPESNSRLGLLTSGQAQIAQSIEAQDFDAAQAAGVAIETRVTPGVLLRLQVNTAEDPVSEEAVRQAISAYIDRDEINTVVFGGRSVPAAGLLTENLPGSAQLPELLAHDPKRGDELLSGAGWTKGDGGLWERDGQPLSFHITKASPYSLSQPLLELVVQQLHANGISADFADYTGDYSEVTSQHKYVILYANTTDLDPDVLRGQISPLDGNRSNLPADDPLTEPLTRQNQIGDWDDRADLLAEIQRDVIDRAIQIPVAALVQFYGVSDQVTGVAFDLESRIYLYDAQLTN
ncbi:MAG: ABC transporter substrate-binding protein [Bifidobacteriaceae bacterium]|jgi:peptide/nickel transport system substrate-binding protein|nr:ABC transporter substrate-binding protein [Bifidobacteriaceae bacterium]